MRQSSENHPHRRTRRRHSGACSTPVAAETLVSALLRWFVTAARPLPWRQTTDPYAVWVSEIMLQQTQVATVIPYYERWMRELPNLQALARARPQKVLKLWEGLGYYSRARNLQKAARQILRKSSRDFPTDLEPILELPGIGRYTAGAICSIAFNQPMPIVDGNVARVLARIYTIRGDPKRSKTAEKFWLLAEQLVRCAKTLEPSIRPEAREARCCSSFNQGMMELGALICTPLNPRVPFSKLLPGVPRR